MRKAYKHKLMPTKKQVRAMEETLETHRRLYNKCLEMRIEAYKERKETLNWYDLKKWLTSVRPENEWYLRCNRNSLDATLKRLELAYQSFFRRVKKKKGKAGFPKFKGRDRFHSFEFVRSGNGFKAPEWSFGQKRTRVYIQNVGNVKMWMDRPMEGKVKTLEVTRDGDHWYACFSCDIGVVEKAPGTGKAVGIDVGLESFVTTSSGEHVENPRFYRKDLTEYKRLSRSLSRKKKGGANRRKAKIALRRKSSKIRNRRMNFIHDLTRKMADEYELVAAEKLSVKGMLQGLKSKSGNKHLRRGMALSISDAGWSMFLGTLKYKLEGTGGSLITVNPAYTSQICSGCGVIVKKDLSVRQHDCPECGLSLHRDVNAAKNILERGYLALAEPAEGNDGQC